MSCARSSAEQEQGTQAQGWVARLQPVHLPLVAPVSVVATAAVSY